MSIKDLPHVTVEQVLALRKAAIDLEQQLADLKASMPKVRADALSDFSNQMDKHSKYAAIKGEFEFSNTCKFAAKVASEQAKLEAGNE